MRSGSPGACSAPRWAASSRATWIRSVVTLLCKSLQFAAIGLGLITALGTIGINVSALVAGLGLTGFALGFALKDLVANVVAGVLVLVYRPFHRQDHVAVAGFEGTVRRDRPPLHDAGDARADHPDPEPDPARQRRDHLARPGADAHSAAGLAGRGESSRSGPSPRLAAHGPRSHRR